MAPDALTAVRASLAAQLAELREEPEASLPPALLDLRVDRVALPGGDAFVLRPREWEQLRHEEGGAGRPVPYWARLWPSGLALARAVAQAPPAPGTRVVELGAGLALPSVAAGRAGARVLATDGHADAVAFAAHVLALNEAAGEVALVDWTAHPPAHGDALAARGPWDLVLAADVLYTAANVRAALALLPRLVEPGGTVLLADPGRAGARDFLAAARASFHVDTRLDGDVALHALRRKAGR
ncbi:MAG TPA: methyltransferase domain-containing protein [Capillimicrobium sp.]